MLEKYREIEWEDESLEVNHEHDEQKENDLEEMKVKLQTEAEKMFQSLMSDKGLDMTLWKMVNKWRSKKRIQ